MTLSEVVVVLKSLLSARQDVQDLSVTIDADGVDVRYEGGPLMLEDDCIFDVCSQGGKAELLRFYFSADYLEARFSWNVGVEFAKLSAKSGMLVRQDAERFFPSDFCASWSRYFLHVAYFGSNSIYEETLVSLMDFAYEDARDGLFIACWHNQSERLQKALISAFVGWIGRGEMDFGTGEIPALESFLPRWKAMFESHVYGKLEEFLKLRSL